MEKGTQLHTPLQKEVARKPLLPAGLKIDTGKADKGYSAGKYAGTRLSLAGKDARVTKWSAREAGDKYSAARGLLVRRILLLGLLEKSTLLPGRLERNILLLGLLERNTSNLHYYKAAG